MATDKSFRFWTIAEVEANLPKILHLVETEGPQGIDAEKSFVITLAEASDKSGPSRKPLGQWLVENMPRGTNLEVPSRRDPDRAIPFVIPSEE